MNPDPPTPTRTQKIGSWFRVHICRKNEPEDHRILEVMAADRKARKAQRDFEKARRQKLLVKHAAAKKGLKTLEKEAKQWQSPTMAAVYEKWRKEDEAKQVSHSAILEEFVVSYFRNCY